MGTAWFARTQGPWSRIMHSLGITVVRTLGSGTMGAVGACVMRTLRPHAVWTLWLTAQFIIIHWTVLHYHSETPSSIWWWVIPVVPPITINRGPTDWLPHWASLTLDKTMVILSTNLSPRWTVGSVHIPIMCIVNFFIDWSSFRLIICWSQDRNQFTLQEICAESTSVCWTVDFMFIPVVMVDHVTCVVILTRDVTVVKDVINDNRVLLWDRHSEK